MILHFDLYGMVYKYAALAKGMAKARKSQLLAGYLPKKNKENSVNSFAILLYYVAFHIIHNINLEKNKGTVNNDVCNRYW